MFDDIHWISKKLKKMNLPQFIIETMNLVESSVENVDKKKIVMQVIEKKLGIDDFSEIEVIIDDMIETIIQISHGKITLDINKIKKCKLLCCK